MYTTNLLLHMPNQNAIFMQRLAINHAWQPGRLLNRPSNAQQ